MLYVSYVRVEHSLLRIPFMEPGDVDALVYDCVFRPIYRERLVMGDMFVQLNVCQRDLKNELVVQGLGI